jgi:hypothetical protein
MSSFVSVYFDTRDKTNTIDESDDQIIKLELPDEDSDMSESDCSECENTESDEEDNGDREEDEDDEDTDSEDDDTEDVSSAGETFLQDMGDDMGDDVPIIIEFGDSGEENDSVVFENSGNSSDDDMNIDSDSNNLKIVRFEDGDSMVDDEPGIHSDEDTLNEYKILLGATDVNANNDKDSNDSDEQPEEEESDEDDESDDESESPTRKNIRFFEQAPQILLFSSKGNNKTTKGFKVNEPLVVKKSPNGQSSHRAMYEYMITTKSDPDFPLE